MYDFKKDKRNIIVTLRRKKYDEYKFCKHINGWIQ